MSAPLTEKPEDTAADDIPRTLPEAVCHVMLNMKKLKKSEHNKHGGYDFTSIDAFLVAMNPLCAKAGLYILQNEVEAEVIPNEKRDKAPHLRVSFEHTLCHRSGETGPAVRRTVMVPAIGPQAFGIAQSYALKQFMRSTFMIATGDGDDADQTEAQSLPKRKSSTQAKKDGDSERLKKLIDDCASVEQLDAIWVGVQKQLELLPHKWFEPYADLVEQTRAALVLRDGGQVDLPGSDAGELKADDDYNAFLILRHSAEEFCMTPDMVDEFRNVNSDAINALSAERQTDLDNALEALRDNLQPAE